MALNQEMCLVYFYVPLSHAPLVTRAVHEAGAGRIGDYDSCAWSVEGMGQFRPLEKARPFSGSPGSLAREAEVKVEVVCRRQDLEHVLAALVSSHPYEEPAYGALPILTLGRERQEDTPGLPFDGAPASPDAGAGGEVSHTVQDSRPGNPEAKSMNNPQHQTARDLEFYRNALLYQELHADFTQDIDFYCTLLEGVSGPILELGAGNSRVGRGLARQGHEVWALDLVEEILDLGAVEARKEGLVLHALKGDMRNFSIEGPGHRPMQFAAIICPLNTMAHLLSGEELLSCLDSVKRHLAPGGIFVPALFVPDPAFLYRDPEALRFVDSFDSPSMGCQVELYEKNSYHPSSQINQLTWFFQPDEGDEVVEESYRLKVWYPAEFRFACKAGGFTLRETWVDYRDKTGPEDPEAISPEAMLHALVFLAS